MNARCFWLFLVLCACGTCYVETQTPITIRYLFIPAACQYAQQSKYLAPVPSSCAQFYSCAPGHVAALMNCSAGTLFDVHHRSCLDERSVQCGARPRPPGALPPDYITEAGDVVEEGGDEENAVESPDVKYTVAEPYSGLKVTPFKSDPQPVRPSVGEPPEGVQYEVAMSGPFTSPSLDFLSCQRLQRALEDVLWSQDHFADCLNNSLGCILPRIQCVRHFRDARLVTSPLPGLTSSSARRLGDALPLPSDRSSLLNYFQMLQHRQRRKI